MTGKAFMVQGVGTNVGKSLIVAGLCRLARQHGLSVAPFKPQNMSNNAAVTRDGGEIGRAQALQAQAAGLEPTRDMNPVLLKPESDNGSQVVVLGKRMGRARGIEYRALKAKLLPLVMEAYNRLLAKHDLVIVEGAGSAAEINLQSSDFANMGFAEAANIPVMLVGDIDRGGVIASLVGTKNILNPEHSARIQGFLINKFRGDPVLFSDARQFITQKTHWPDLGLLPWFGNAHKLPAEDSVDLARHQTSTRSVCENIHIGVPLWPRLANFDDLDPLRQQPGVSLSMIKPGETLPLDLDLVILPGSKSVQGDLLFFREQGWDIDLQALVRRGIKVLGLCGGYQMLGQTIADPDGIESDQPISQGLGLLDVMTHLTPEKTLSNVSGCYLNELSEGLNVTGYEMHIGLTEGADCERPFMIREDESFEGARSKNNQIMGTYVHGLFADDHFRTHFLSSVSQKTVRQNTYQANVEKCLDGMAELLSTHTPLLKNAPWLRIP